MTLHKLGPLFVISALGLTLAGAVGSAAAALSLRVTPQMTSAPGVVVVTVTVDRHESNRALLVEADSGTYYRSSELTLEGDRAARRHVLTFRDLPAGQHKIRAAVRGSRGIRATQSTTVTVVGEGTLE